MKLPKFLFDRIKEHNSSLGNNEAFPPEEDLPFDYKILKNRFNEVCENLHKININTDDFNEIRNYLGKLLQRCKEIEEPIRPNLIKLCESWVNNQLGTPMETIILNCELVNEIKPNHAFRVMPESSDMRDFDFEDLNDFDNVSKVILKRRLINALIQGVSYNCNKYGNIDEELKQLNEELPNLYNEISIINDYLLFTQEEKITDKKPRQGACVEVMLGSNGEKTEINVQGLIFPYLLQETFRGFFELFASHGLPEDNDKANYILKQADFLLAEPWDIRMGVGLWNILSENIDDPKILPFFFTALCEMPVEEFNENLREVFAKTKRGKQFIQELIDESMIFVEKSKIIDVEPQKNYNFAVLNDEYISSDELDDYVLTEDGENDYSFESWYGKSVLVDEYGAPLKMYHGTKNTFDEFSKDYIGSTGAYEGYGFNFTPFSGRASNYNSENIIEAYLRAENPMTSKTYKITPSKLSKIIAELDKDKPYTDTIVAAYEPSRYNEKWDAMYYRRALPVAARMIYQYNKENGYGDAGLYAEICLNGNADKYQVIDLFERLGYDSVIFYDNDDRINTVIVFEPNQIKLTTNKYFNNNSNLMGESS